MISHRNRHNTSSPGTQSSSSSSPSSSSMSSSSSSCTFSPSSSPSFSFLSRPSSHFVLVVLSLFLLSLSSFSLFPLHSSLTFRLSQGEELCLSDFVTSGDLMIGEYSVTPQGAKIQLNFYDPKGNQIHTKLIGAQTNTQTGNSASPSDYENRFAHTSSMSGTYKTCFVNNIYSADPYTGQSIPTKTVDFDLSVGDKTKDVQHVAKKDSLKPIEIDLKRLEDVVSIIFNDVKYLNDREVKMKQTNESTGKQVVWFSIISVFIVVGLKFAELVYLKKYFQAKKMIN